MFFADKNLTKYLKSKELFGAQSFEKEEVGGEVLGKFKERGEPQTNLTSFLQTSFLCLKNAGKRQ